LAIIFFYRESSQTDLSIINARVYKFDEKGDLKSSGWCSSYCFNLSSFNIDIFLHRLSLQADSDITLTGTEIIAHL